MGYFSTWLQNNRLTKPAYKFAKKMIHRNDFSIRSLNVITSSKEESDKVRVNLVLPTLNKYKIFGGIATALKVYEALAEIMNADMRIIVNRQEKYNEKYSLIKEDYLYNGTSGQKQVVFLTNMNNCLSVRKKDVFVCTSWDTAYCFEKVMSWKKQVFGDEYAKKIYLIQDYEPGFYPWSTEYVLAESTYKTGDTKTVAIFNSEQLYDFFELRGYQFYKKEYFTPYLNEKLAEHLEDNGEPRKQRILIYGRPGTQRNVFEIIVHALRLWKEKYPNSQHWEIIALGETFDDIDLGNNVKIRCLGKASLEGYAKTMLESYIGISLMASPHPSYPPLEMSIFGIKVITNQFENKDLGTFNDNIISLDKCTPEIISNVLCDLCAEYPNKIADVKKDSKYVKDNSSFMKAVNDAAEAFRCW